MIAPVSCSREPYTTGLRRGWMVFGLGVIGLMNAIVYQYQLQDTNSSAGFQPIIWSASCVMRVTVGLALVSAWMPTGLRRPSDVFQLLYGLFVPISYAIFHEIGGTISTTTYASRLAMLCVPMAVIGLATHIRLSFSSFGLLTRRQLIAILLATSGLVVIAIMLLGPQTSGFSLEETYIRRLEGRETFPAGSLLAYAGMMTANGLAPTLAFLGAITGYRWLLSLSIAIGICFFFTIGLKAPLAFMALIYLFGLGFKHRMSSMFHRAVFLILGLTFLLFIIEYNFLEGYSLIAAETIYRRAFAVPAGVLTHYFDMMFGANASLWNWTTGVGANAPEGVTYLVGNLYYTSDTANVNTNAFVVALAGGGALSFFLALALTTVIMVLLNAIHAKTSDNLCMGIAFVYSILLSEQAATTALVSSGVGTLLFLAILSGRDRRDSISATETLIIDTSNPNPDRSTSASIS